MTGQVDAAAKTVRDGAIDIAVLLDVGMSAKSVLLANLRLAWIQCAAWGHPVTTGSDFVNHFISCGDMEPEDARAHYSDTLLRLPGTACAIGPRLAHPRERARANRAPAGQTHLPVSAIVVQDSSRQRCTVRRAR